MAKIGIDFGTTNSLMVAYNKEKNEFEYFHGEGYGKLFLPKPTSSTIMYHDNSILVGNEARELMYKYYGVEGYHFEKSIKLNLGTDYLANVFGDPIEPYKIAAEIISHLKNEASEKNAEVYGIDLKNAVFTIPVNFSGKARRDLRKAANEAGISVTTFIHEPFAAVVGYYFTQKKTYQEIMNNLKELDGTYSLVFDWGGGTLDITVVLIKNGKMYEMGTSELTKRAGDKFDEDLARYVWNDFCNKYANRYSSDFLEVIRKRRWGRLIALAERCKKELSEKEESEFILDAVTADDDVYIDMLITRNDFENIIQETIIQAINKVDDALRQAGIQDLNIAHVLLTGGTCYIPAVQDAMKKKFGHRVENVSQADLLIAQGAAVISELGWLPFLTKDILVEMSNGAYWPMFESGSPIAAGQDTINTERFISVDSRFNRAKVIVCEGLQQKVDKVLAILNVPLYNSGRFSWGDEIEIMGKIDQDIVLQVSGRSMLIKENSKDGAYSERKVVDIFQLCFGLDFRR